MQRVRDTSRMPPCAHCGAAAAKLQCTRCGCSAYCSREHRKLHWRAVHKRECQPSKHPEQQRAREDKSREMARDNLRGLTEQMGNPKLKEELEQMAAMTPHLAAARGDLGVALSPGRTDFISSGKALKHWQSRACACCGKKESDAKLRKCAKCVKHKVADAPAYCGVECQTKHWGEHKLVCGKSRPAPPEFSGTWYDAWRGSTDDSRHFGQLELITWDGTGENGVPLGFAGCYACESAETRARFEGKCKGKESRFAKDWPSGFRWTCCGVDIAAGLHGCDHHGDPRAQHACGCDFCRAGQPLSDDIWRKKLRSQAAHGLEETLRRGPDARSLSQAGLLNWQMRNAFGFG